MASHNLSPDSPAASDLAMRTDSPAGEAAPRNQYVIGSALRTLELLKVFMQAPHRFTAAELQQITALEKNQLYRSVKTLEEADYIATAPDGRYEMSELIRHLGSFVARPAQLSLPLIAAPFLDELGALTGESINLFVRHGDYAVCVDRRDSPHMVRLASVLGVSAPLHAGAVPKAMLAFLPEDEQERILTRLADLPAYTPHTVLDADRLRQELEETRLRGYSISDGDYDAAARGVGAPIFDELGTVVAGISVGGPSFRVGKDTLRTFGELAVRKAEEVSLCLRQAG